MLYKKKNCHYNCKYIGKQQWLFLFSRIEEINNITRVANEVGIRRQLLSAKYNQWKKYGNDFLEMDIKRPLFTKKEEHMLLLRILNYKNEVGSESVLNNTIIKIITTKFYNEIYVNRKTNDFIVDQKWILDFKRRYGIKENNLKSYYLQWEIL